ncbi:NAD(P)/FAD-dependent oxidoreductase [Rossellomorea sp. NS-SX7]|uniref:NAD(P)/FAD-dependent oxidoreductase n=1 Tax=Rossellomorea sp. NS-SX7 TaxID=3463856 RepID=UPI004057D510
MKVLTCIVIGGGYAGINTIKSIQKSFRSEVLQRQIRIVLIDKNPYHLRKVLLFKPAARNKEITIPLNKLFSEEVEFVQATVTKIDPKEKKLLLQDSYGNMNSMNYDLLTLAVGSSMRRPDNSQGGIALASLDEAMKIQEKWQSNLKKAKTEVNETERRRLMTIAVAGAGISGIETAAELSHYVREEANQLGIDPSLVKIYLINSKMRLFPDGPEKVGKKIERKLESKGVKVLHGTKVLMEKEGILTLSNRETMSVGICIWTIGMLPNPMLRTIGLPTTFEGYVDVDDSYRVQGAQGVYSIGDCAQIQDPKTGKNDGKTCKEAIAQAERLTKIMLADLEGLPSPVHKEFIDFFCFGLGPEDGMTWIRKWGIDIILTGKLGWGIRKLTWNSASLISNVKEDSQNERIG